MSGKNGNKGFLKIDFHVHTPVSECYYREFRNATPREIVQGAQEAGLDAFVIADHNTAQNITPIAEVAKTKGITVFPGIELTTPGGHVLAFFDPESPISQLEALIRDVGISPNQEGIPHHETKDWIEEVFRKIVLHGGMAVAAHVEREPRGFLEQVRDRRVRQNIHASEYLTALEITVPSWKDLWNDGLVKGYPKKYPVIQGSDAHAPNELGRRPVYVKTPSLTLNGLRYALLRHPECVFFPQDAADTD